MLIESFTPYLELVLEISLIMMSRFLDSGFTMFDKIPKTKSKTINQFMENYMGPEVMLH
jgi:hypothetical protein